MNDTKKITLVSFCALVLGFAGLYIYVELFEFTQFAISETNNSSSDLSIDEKRIFIFGGSSSIVLNNTHIESYISDRGFNQYGLYNFAWVADTPTKRLIKLDQLISAEPTLVVYGLGFQHMGYILSPIPPTCLNTDESTNNSNIQPNDSLGETKSLMFIPRGVEGLPSVKDAIKYFEQIFQIQYDPSSNLANPKHVTVNILKNYFEGNGAEINQRKNPGFIDPKLFDIISLIDFSKIHSLEKLNKPSSLTNYVCPEDLKKEMASLKEIYLKLHEKNIKFVIFITPYVQSFLDTIDENEVNSFLSLLKEFSKENNFNFYSLHDKYVKLEIFNDMNHVAINPASIIFSNDVAEIILKNLGTVNLRYVDTTNNDLRFMNFSYADLRGVDLSYKDLMGADLHNSNLFGAKLNGTNLSETDLSYAYLRESDLSNKDLSGTILVGSNLAGSNLYNVSLSGKDLTASDLTNVDLSNKDLTGTILTRAKLDYANLTGVDLSGKDLSGTSLRGVDLSGKDFTGTILVESDLSLANLTGVDLSGKDLSGTSLRGVDLSGKDFTGTNLKSTSLAGAILKGVDLSGKDLSNADLQHAYLFRAKLFEVDLSGHDLTETMLYNVDLSKTNLTGTILLRSVLDYANLTGVDLSGKDLSGTRLRGVDLSGTDFTGSFAIQADFRLANLSGANFAGARIEKTDFTSADLSYANFSNAFLYGSNFTNVNLTGAVLSCFHNPICK